MGIQDSNQEESFSAIQQENILNLLDYLKSSKYYFLCPTPETHERYLSSRKSGTTAQSLTDVFGWSMPIERLNARELLPLNLDIDSLFEPIISNDNDNGDLVKAIIRVSSLNVKGPLHLHSRAHKDTAFNLYVHSSYPCRGFGKSGVFCGPDTYRFLSYLSFPHIRSWILESSREVKSHFNGTATAIDLGCGPGAGALGLSGMYGDVFNSIVGLDINPFAISFAKINTTVHQKSLQAMAKNSSLSIPTFQHSSFFSEASHIKDLSLVISNPPYIPSATATGVYCDGGEDGISFALEVIDRSLAKLVPSGLLIMHTGVCIPASSPGTDRLLQKCELLERNQDIELLEYVIIDNDVFGEEIALDPRKSLGWIHAVGLVLRKR